MARATTRKTKRSEPSTAACPPADSASTGVDTPQPAVDMTEGQRLLREVPGSLADLAAAIGCSRQTIANWRSGSKVPDDAHRAKACTAWAIPPDAWDHAAGTPTPVAVVGRRRAAPEQVSPRGDTAPPDTASTPTTLEDCLSLLGSIRTARDRPNLSSEARLKYISAEGRILTLRARLEQEQQLLEDRIVLEHPMWQRLKRTLVRVLAPYPDAAQAVATALADVEREPTPTSKSA